MQIVPEPANDAQAKDASDDDDVELIQLPESTKDVQGEDSDSAESCRSAKNCWLENDKEERKDDEKDNEKGAQGEGSSERAARSLHRQDSVIDRSKLPGSSASKQGWSDADMNSMLQNILVAVIGTGEPVWALAERRIQERGRLLVLLTDRSPSGRYADDGEFKWCPPGRVKLVEEQARQMARKYNVGSARRWIRKGPDIVELKEDEDYEVNEEGRGLRVVNSHGQIVWEVSAKTLIAGDVDVGTEMSDLGISTGCFAVVPVPSASSFFGFMGMSLFWHSIGFCFNDYEKEDMLPYFRMWNILAIAGVWGIVSGNMFWGASAVGIENTSTKAKVQGFLIAATGYSALTIVPFGSSTLTSFAVTNINVMTVCFLVLIPLHWYNVAQPEFPLKPGEKAPERVSFLGLDFARPRYWKWACVLISTGFGSWLAFYMLGVVYVLLNTAGWAKTANIMLPIVVTTMEGMAVGLLQKGYTAYVFKPRASGSPWYGLSCNTCGLHAFSESLKLAATVSGAAFCEDNPNGLKWPSEGSCNPYGWVGAVIVALVVDILVRYGWVRFVLGCVVRAAGFTTLAKRVAPSVASKLHDEAKFYVAYARFVIPGSVVLANVATGKPALIFNWPATWCCIATVLMEVVEDVLVATAFIPCSPSPAPEEYMEYDNNDPMQLYTFGTSPLEELSSRKIGQRRSCSPPTILRTDGDYFPCALPLHGTRSMTPLEYVLLPGLSVFFTLALYQLLLGAGYFHGVCDHPLPKIDIREELVLWPLPLNKCRYSE